MLPGRRKIPWLDGWITARVGGTPFDDYFAPLAFAPTSSRGPSMRSSSLLTYFSLILSSWIGVLAQTEKAVCHPKFQWVRRFLRIPEGGSTTCGDAKVETKRFRNNPPTVVS